MKYFAMADRNPVLTPREQFKYNRGVVVRAGKGAWMGVTGCGRAILQMILNKKTTL